MGEIFENPCHPYTRGLLGSIPSERAIREKSRLTEIPGMVPSLLDLPAGLHFSARVAPGRSALCDGDYPPFFEPSAGHRVACWLYR